MREGGGERDAEESAWMVAYGGVTAVGGRSDASHRRSRSSMDQTDRVSASLTINASLRSTVSGVFFFFKFAKSMIGFLTVERSGYNICNLEPHPLLHTLLYTTGRGLCARHPSPS